MKKTRKIYVLLTEVFTNPRKKVWKVDGVYTSKKRAQRIVDNADGLNMRIEEHYLNGYSPGCENLGRDFYNAFKGLAAGNVHERWFSRDR